MARIFLSHSSKDNDRAKDLITWLNARGHQEYFLDFDKHAGIQPGADWERTLYREISRAQAIVILLTENWMASKWCFAEFTQARALGKAIFPVIEDPAGERFVGTDLQAIDLRNERDGGLERLSVSLSELALSSAEGFELSDGVVPFPGLSAFDERHAAVFFGRDDDIARLREAVTAARARDAGKLIALLGASGAGKSSLVRAGLIPRLRRDKRNWIVPDAVRPEAMPAPRIASSLLRLACPAPDTGGTDIHAETRERLRSGLMSEAPGAALAETAHLAREQAGALDAWILIAVDQAEELFSRSDDASRKAGLGLISALSGSDLPIVTVLTIRSDGLEDLQRAEGLTVPFSQVSLPPMPLERIGALVRGPARIANLTVEDGLVSALMRDAGSTDALPLIAFTLERLYQATRDTGALTLSAYQALGDPARNLSPLDNAVHKAAEEALPPDLMTDETWTALRHAFVPALVTVNDEGGFVRQPAVEDTLPAAARPPLDRLVNARLLVRRTEDGATVLEVAHEALFRVWDRLVSWLDEERDGIAGRKRLKEALADWQALDGSERERGLLAGVLLDRGKQWLIDRPETFTPDEKAFIQASADAADQARRAEEARREREVKMQRRLARGAIAAALIFAVIGGVAGWQWTEATQQRELARANEVLAEDRATEAEFERQRAEREANLKSEALAQSISNESVGLAAQSHLVRLTKPEDNLKVSRMLALASWPVDQSDPRPRTTEAINALSAASAGPYLHALDLTKAKYLEEVDRILTWDGNRARYWDPKTGQPVGAEMTLPDDYERLLAVNRDGTVVLLLGKDRGKKQTHVRIWSLAEARELTPRLTHELLFSRAAFSADETRILSWTWSGGGAKIWDASSGRQIGETMSLPNGITHAELSPDESRVLAAGSFMIRIFDAETGVLAIQMDLPNQAEVNARLDPSGSFVVSWSKEWGHSESSAIRIWDSRNGTELHAFGPFPGDVEDVAFLEDSRVMIAQEDGTIRFWDLTSGEQTLAPLQIPAPLLGVSLHAEQKMLLAWSENGTVQTWNLETGEAAAPTLQHPGIKGGFFTANGERLVTWSPAANEAGAALIGLWERRNGTLLGNPFQLRGGSFRELVQLPDDRFLAIGGGFTAETEDQSPVIWDAGIVSAVHARIAIDSLAADYNGSGDRILTVSDASARLWDAQSGEPISAPMDYNCEGNAVLNSVASRVLAYTTLCFEAYIFDAETGQQLSDVLQHEGQVTHGIFSPDDRHVVTTDREGNVFAWEAESGRYTGKNFSHTTEAWGAAFSSDGARLLTWAWDKTAKLWDFQSGRQIGPTIQHSSTPTNGRFSPDGGRFLTWANGAELGIWDGLTAEPVLTGLTIGDGMDGALFAPDGNHVLGWNGGIAHLWSLAAGKHDPIVLEMGGIIHGASFAPDSRLLLIWTRNHAHIWNFKDGTRYGLPIRPEGGVSKAEFIGNGKYLLISEATGTSIWDVTFTAQIGTRIPANFVAMHPDDTHVLVSLNGKMAVWNIEAYLTGDLHDFVCTITGTARKADFDRVQAEGFTINKDICAANSPDPEWAFQR
ncbi:MAG: TIR domain-containing protein [Pseudomonadota bacterium]